MASIRFHYSTKTHSFIPFNPSKSQSKIPSCLNANKQSHRRRRGVFAASPPSCNHQLIRRESDHQPERGVNSAEVERWMKGSVEEIVKNLQGDSPLVVEVYAEGKDDNKAHFEFGLSEKAVPNDWEKMRNELQKRCPDGLIFVEQLVTKDEDEDDGSDRCWGIVIQGKGGDSAPVCYLLKTCKVMAAMGMGLSCTYFCLVKVKSFRESAFGHFKNSWLYK